MKLVSANMMEEANKQIALQTNTTIEVDYTNWRGVKSKRRIHAIRFERKSTEWHPEECVMLLAFDFDKDAYRDFKIVDFDRGTLSSRRMTSEEALQLL
tara:strand:- start:1701 stop:1994 length:294 start_codon:yes stop_codon:yes gene_type:complete